MRITNFGLLILATVLILTGCANPAGASNPTGSTNQTPSGGALSLTGTISTIAGLAFTKGSTDAVGSAARFDESRGVCSDGTNLYIADANNNKIRKVVIATGAVSTLAGSGTIGTADGSATTATFSWPAGVATDGTYVYVAESLGGSKIRKVAISNGAVTSLGTGFSSPYGLTIYGGKLYVADTYNYKIKQVDLSTGTVTTIAGTGSQGRSDGTGTAASFDQSMAVATDGTNLYVADYGSNTIRKIVISTGVVTTIAGTGSSGKVNATGTAASFNAPYGIATDGTNLYVADCYNNMIRKIVISSGVVTTLVGGSSFGDGTGTSAGMAMPMGIAVGSNCLYIAEYSSRTIRKVL